MRTTIDINIDNARMTLIVASGSYERAKQIENMSDEEIKDLVIKHCLCWGISEVKNETDVNGNT